MKLSGSNGFEQIKKTTKNEQNSSTKLREKMFLNYLKSYTQPIVCVFVRYYQYSIFCIS